MAGASSSSSSAAKAGEDAFKSFPSACALRPRRQAHLVSDAEHLVLSNSRRHGWSLRHTISMEMQRLPELVDEKEVRQWTLELGEDEELGLVATLEDGEMSGLMLDGIMKNAVYMTEDGQYLVVNCDDKDAVKELDILKRDFSVNSAKLGEFGVLSEPIALDIAIFAMPRSCGCRVVWSLPSWYSKLRLQIPRGCPNWLATYFPIWQKHLDTLSLNCTLLRGTETRGRRNEPVQEHDVVPWKAASSIAFVGIVSRLCAASSRSGGVKDDDSKRAAIEGFFQFLVACASQGAWSLHLCLDPSHKVSPWPGAGEENGFYVECEVVDGQLSGMPAFPDSITKNLREFFVDGRAHLSEVMLALQASKASIVLFAQVVQQLGSRLDALVLSEGEGCIEIDQKDGESVNYAALVAKLSGYMHDCARTFAENDKFLSGTGDKSRVGSLGIYNGIAVGAGGHGFALPPQDP